MGVLLVGALAAAVTMRYDGEYGPIRNGSFGRWSVLKIVPGGEISGISTPWRDFPAVVPAHTMIRLLLTIHRPASCHDSQFAADGKDLYTGSHRVHWKSLLRSHVTTVEDQLPDIHLC